MIKRLLTAIVLTAGLLSAQNPETASFPSAVVTDQKLGVEHNRGAANLAAAINNSVLSIPVADGSQFRVNQWIGIDSEFMQVSAINGNTLTVYARGGQGSAAASHAQYARVYSPVTAQPRNQVAAEIKAIETAIGANYANVATKTELNTKANTTHAHAAADINASDKIGTGTKIPTANALTGSRCVQTDATGMLTTGADACNVTQVHTHAAADINAADKVGNGAKLPTVDTLTASRCVETDINGKLVSAGAACGVGGGSGDVTGGTSLTTVGAVPRVTATGQIGMSKFSCSGTPVTCEVYDNTAVNGISIFSVRAGAAQGSNALTEWKDAAGVVLSRINETGALVAPELYIANSTLNATAVGFKVANNRQFLFSSTASAGGTADLGLYRYGAGVLEINNGVAGTFRDLRLRHITMVSGTFTNVGTTDGCATWTSGVLGSSGAPCGGSGSVTVENNGTTVGTRAVNNYIPGTGFLWTFADTGTRINITGSVDTNVVLTRDQNQAGTDTFVTGTSANATAYVVAPVGNTIVNYVTGMRLLWKPDVSCTGGPTTINVSTLGAKAITLADGTTHPTATDCAANKLVPIAYDGTQFRIVGGGATGSVSLPAQTAATKDKTLVSTGVAGAEQWKYDAPDIRALTQRYRRSWIYSGTQGVISYGWGFTLWTTSAPISEVAPTGTLSAMVGSTIAATAGTGKSHAFTWSTALRAADPVFTWRGAFGVLPDTDGYVAVALGFNAEGMHLRDDDYCNGTNSGFGGVGFVFKGGRDTNWQVWSCVNAATPTLRDSGVPFAANTMFLMEIGLVGGNLTAKINGAAVTIADATANIPTAGSTKPIVWVRNHTSDASPQALNLMSQAAQMEADF